MHVFKDAFRRHADNWPDDLVADIDGDFERQHDRNKKHRQHQRSDEAGPPAFTEMQHAEDDQNEQVEVADKIEELVQKPPFAEDQAIGDWVDGDNQSGRHDRHIKRNLLRPLFGYHQPPPPFLVGDGDRWDPVAFPAIEAACRGLAVKIGGRPCKAGRIDAFEAVHIDNRIELVLDQAGHEGHHAAAPTDMEIGGSGAEPIMHDQGVR